MPNAPHTGGDFDAFGDHRIHDPNLGVFAKSRDIPMPEVDDRFPDARSQFEIPLTPLERLGIITDINKQQRRQIDDVGIPAYAPDPYEPPPPGYRPPESYEAQPLVTPGEGIDSTKGFLGDLHAEVRSQVDETLN